MKRQMEVMNSSTINETWKLCTIGGFLGFFVLAVFLTTSPENVEVLSTARSSTAVVTFVETTRSATGGGTGTATAPEPQRVGNVSATVVSRVNSSSNSAGVEEPNGRRSGGSSNNSSSGGVSGSTASSESSNVSSSSTGAGSPPSTLSQPPLGAAATTTTTNNNDTEAESPAWPEYDLDSAAEVEADAMSTTAAGGESKVDRKQRCNIFEGRWVYRPNVSPMYSVYQCPFLEPKMSCRRNGRPDTDYEGWSWEPSECDIPLFNGKDMLERMRGKRMLIAGDSLNRNMWESLACLLYTSIIDPSSSSRVLVDAAGSTYKVLKAMDYNFTLEFYWCPFLVDLEENNQHQHHHKNKKQQQKRVRVLHLDRLVPSSEQWRGADVMVFDSGHWWTHRDKWDVFQYDGKTVAEMPIESAYERALTTWTNWVAAAANTADPVGKKKTPKVFFRSISPEHKGKQWCFNATRPILDESYVNIYPKSMIDVVERVVGGGGEGSSSMSKDTTTTTTTTTTKNNMIIRYLNITRLSGYRQDAHPAMYRYEEWKWKILTQRYMRLVPQQADCSHWCLPGLPDTWNRLLYVSLFYNDHDDGGNVVIAKADDGNNEEDETLRRIIDGGGGGGVLISKAGKLGRR